MKWTAVPLMAAIAAIGSAQYCRPHRIVYSYPGYYGSYATRIGGVTLYSRYRPNVIYVGRTVPTRMPYAYGSFFYGQSWSSWECSQARRHRWR